MKEENRNGRERVRKNVNKLSRRKSEKMERKRCKEKNERRRK